MAIVEERPVVGVVTDPNIIRQFRHSLDQEERGEVVPLEDAYRYWVRHHEHYPGSHLSVGRFLSGVALPASIGALVGSVLTLFLRHDREYIVVERARGSQTTSRSEAATATAAEQRVRRAGESSSAGSY